MAENYVVQCPCCLIVVNNSSALVVTSTLHTYTRELIVMSIYVAKSIKLITGHFGHVGLCQLRSNNEPLLYHYIIILSHFHIYVCMCIACLGTGSITYNT